VLLTIDYVGAIVSAKFGAGIRCRALP